MKPLGVALTFLELLLGVLVWRLGWPSLQEINDALNLLLFLVVIVAAIFFGIILLLMIRSQLEPPYDS